MKASEKIADVMAKLKNKMSFNRFLVVVAIITGVCAGLGAAILKDLITTMSNLVKGIFPINDLNIFLFIVPILGILLCGIFCRYIVKDDLEFGCERILHSIKLNNYYMKSNTIWAPMIGCTLTIGFGGAAGSEGPIAYTGAGIGSNLGRIFKLPPEMVRTLVIIGASAGIAGIFKAPIGGVMFALEVLALEMTTGAITALVFACLSAAFVAYAFSGFTIDVAFMPKNFFEVDMTLGVILLGVFCGLYSVYYSAALRQTESFFKAIKNPWVKNLLSGCIIGGLIFIFPILYGEGYEVITNILNGNDSTVMGDTFFYNFKHDPWVLALFLFLTLIAKSVATAATNSGGGVSGDFAPTLFAGCMAGLLFAFVSNSYLGTHFNVANFALFGMTGVMAGAIQAPLMAIFITTEMVGDFAMFFPLTITGMVSYVVVKIVNRHLNINPRPSWLHGLDERINSWKPKI